MFVELVLSSDLHLVSDSFLFGVVFKSKGKEKEDISKSLEKLHIEESSSGSAGSSSINFKKKPVIIIVVGMAGIVCFNMTNFSRESSFLYSETLFG